MYLLDEDKKNTVIASILSDSNQPELDTDTTLSSDEISEIPEVAWVFFGCF
jgi:hypothetical protein